MADQTKVVGNGRPENPSKAMRRGMSGFAHDLATLAELQVRLLATDVKETTSRVLWPAIAIGMAAVLLLACLPVLLLGIAHLLVQADWLTIAWAYLLTAAVAIVISALVGLIAFGKLRRSCTTLQRSKDELLENLSWLKRVLKSQAENDPSYPLDRPVEKY